MATDKKKSNPKKQHRRKPTQPRGKPVSLAPLDFKEVLEGLLAVKPEPKPKKRKEKEKPDSE